MGTLSNSVGRANNNLSTDAKVTKPSQSSDSHSNSPLLSMYDRDELIARQTNLMQLEQDHRLEISVRERKAYADSLVAQFELTGSNLPADANPRQLHLF
jgi:N12 class adenine-specific DNA methylase